MAQSDCRRSKKSTPSHLDQFKRKKPPQKRLVWLFYQGVKTQGAKGFETKGPAGSKNNWLEAGNLKTWFTRTQFYGQADVSFVVVVAAVVDLLLLASILCFKFLFRKL